MIGAGAAGLSAARHLTSEPDAFDVQVFEQSSCVGGTWVFTEDTGVDERGIPVHSSVYRNLRYIAGYLYWWTLSISIVLNQFSGTFPFRHS